VFDEPSRELLDRRGLLGVVCTLRRDGSPQANPLWFRRDGDRIHIWTDEDRHWVKNLRRTPQVAFSVHENVSPWASVTVRGTAAAADLGPGETLEEIRLISARYIASEEIDAYVEAWPQTRSIITIHPHTVFAAQAFEDPIAHRRP
jgi:PPOX class probable F420-dependent enzyme